MRPTRCSSPLPRVTWAPERAPRGAIGLLVAVLLTACASRSGDTGSPSASPAGSPNIWTKPSATLDPTALPLGDGKYVTDAPKLGYVYTCDPKYFRFSSVVGATTVGEWIHGSTFDMTAKISVQGGVVHEGAFATSTAADRRVFTGNG